MQFYFDLLIKRTSYLGLSYSFLSILITANILSPASCFVLLYWGRGRFSQRLSPLLNTERFLGICSFSVAGDHLVISARLQRVEKWVDNEITEHSKCQRLTGEGHPSPIL